MKKVHYLSPYKAFVPKSNLTYYLVRYTGQDEIQGDSLFTTGDILLGTLNLIIYGTHILHDLTLDIEAQFLSRFMPTGCH